MRHRFLFFSFFSPFIFLLLRAKKKTPKTTHIEVAFEQKQILGLKEKLNSFQWMTEDNVGGWRRLWRVLWEEESECANISAVCCDCVCKTADTVCKTVLTMNFGFESICPFPSLKHVTLCRELFFWNLYGYMDSSPFGRMLLS